MPDACGRFRGEEISSRRFEELKDGFVLPYRRVRDIDDDPCSSQGVSQTFSRDGVNPRRGRGRHNFVAALAKVVDDLRSNKAAAANNDDFHFLVHLFDLSTWFCLRAVAPSSCVKELLLLSTASGVANFENGEVAFETTCGVSTFADAFCRRIARIPDTVDGCLRLRFA